MRLAFPYMGNLHIPLGALIRGLGAETIIPPPPDDRTKALGTRYAPEHMCIPFKLTLGSFIRALLMGADTLCYGSGLWQCRYGYYFRLHQSILADLGYRFRVITLRADELPNLIRQIVSLNHGSRERAFRHATRALFIGWLKSTTLELLETAARWYRPREAVAGITDRILHHYLRQLNQLNRPGALIALRRSARAAFARVPLAPDRNPLKIRIIGESYCLLEPYVNLNLLTRLGEMGAWADPFLSTHRWLGFHSLRLGFWTRQRLLRPARNYWRYGAGGEDEPSVAYLIDAARRGYDGVIHLHPFGCMPSTAVSPVLRLISREYQIPLLDISLDEHTTELGCYNRIEAFLAIIQQQRQRKACRRMK